MRLLMLPFQVLGVAYEFVKLVVLIVVSGEDLS